MDHMYDRLCKKGVVMDVSRDGLFDEHKVALRLMQVEAAAAQGNCSLALRLLKTTHEVVNCGVLFTFKYFDKCFLFAMVEPFELSK